MVESTNPIIADLDKDLNKNKQDIQDQIDRNLKSDNDKSKTKTPESEKDDKPDGDKPDTGTADPKKDDKPKEDEAPAQNIPAVNDGISHAYAEDMPPQKTVTKGKSQSNAPKPPERGKSPKVAGGKDIMEVVWNEFWAFCDSVIDGTVDLAFDFLTFVLYPTSHKSEDPVKKDIDVIEIGSKHRKENIEKIDKAHKFASDVCAEINRNIDNAMAGEKTEWPLIKTEPALFARLVEAKKKAQKDPTSPEAEIIKRWEGISAELEKTSNNYRKLTGSADVLATSEEYLNPSTKNKEAEIKAAKEKYKDNPEKLKETLAAIEELYKNPEKKIKAGIAERSQNYLADLSKNINKIRVLHKDNPAELQKVLKEYMEGISKAMQNVREDVYVHMYKEKSTGSKAQKSAQASIAAVVSAINDFKVKDKPLKDHKPAEKDEVINMEMNDKYSKLDVLRFIKSNIMSK